MPRYELTDAIDKGEPGRALVVLHRMLDAGGLAPVQVLATLHGHFSNMLALDGDDVGNERDAAAILGTAPFVAKKALEQSRRLGSTRIAEAINLIAAADLDVRGASGLDAEIVVEILVARLARQTRPARSARRAARRAALGRPSSGDLRPTARRTTSGGSRGPGRRTRAARSPGRSARCRSGHRPPGAGVVGVDVGDDDRRGRRGQCGPAGRGHLVLGRHPVQPDGGVADAHLAVHDGAVVESVEPAGREAERPDEEVVGRLDVLVDEDGDDGAGRRGGVVSWCGHGLHSAGARRAPSWTNLTSGTRPALRPRRRPGSCRPGRRSRGSGATGRSSRPRSPRRPGCGAGDRPADSSAVACSKRSSRA